MALEVIISVLPAVHTKVFVGLGHEATVFTANRSGKKKGNFETT